MPPTRLFALLALTLPGAAAASPAASGGPDSYGYSFADSTGTYGPTYEGAVFTNAVALGVELTTADAADDTAQSITLPFTFQFYGTSYSTVYACSDGYVAFSSTCTYTNATFSSNTQAMIAPFWDDLDNRGTGTSSMYYYTSGSSPNRIFNVVFVDTTHYAYTSSYGNATFAVQLYETSNDAVLQLKDVTFEGTGGSAYSAGLSATTGIDGGSTSGYYSQYNSAAAQLSGSTAVWFSTTMSHPTAEANGPYTPSEGVAMSLSASGSTTASVTYAYDCDGDGTFETTGTTATSYSCTYPEQGSYTAKVLVTNTNTGIFAYDTATVTVANAAPTPTSWAFTSGYTSYLYGLSGGTLTFTMYAEEGDTQVITPTATDVAADTVTISTDWGDGSSTSGASGAAYSHTYDDNGVYTLETVAEDEDGGSTDFSTYAGYLVYYWIDNVDPTLDMVAVSAGSESAAATFASSASDVGAGDTLTYAWDFGDGASSTSDSATHQYADEGTYSWSLVVADDDAGSDVTSGTVVVTNIAPTISSATLVGATEGTAASFSATAAAGLSDTLAYTWDFGDGATGTGATALHTYSDDGTYAVILVVTDDDGTSATWTGTATVTNVAPILGSLSVGAAEEGSALSLSIVASDVGGDTLSYSWTFGDGDTATTSTGSTTHAYADEGSYAVSVVVTDGDGGSDSETGTAVVTNAAPVFTVSSLPSTGFEGTAVSGSAAATDAGTTDVVTYTWDWGDGTTSAGASGSHTYEDDAVYLVTVTAADADGGSATSSGYATISGVDPVISAYSSPGTVDEGSATAFSATATDAGAADTLTYVWNWGDGDSSTGDTVSHSWADNGTYLVSLKVEDDDGLAASETFVAIVDNVVPSVGSISAATGDEGVAQTLSAVFTDPGRADTFTYAWDFGDGTMDTVANPDHAWPDEGTYTVSLVVTDDDGGASSTTAAVDISNVDPVITSTPTPTADESGAWTYAPSADDVAADALTWSLTTMPTGMTVDAASGALDWTPSWADAGSPVSVILAVADADGGSGAQSFAITVTATDSDGDGLPDGFEDAYGLDKSDPSDAGGDLDSDGVSDADEFVDGTDPTVFDGPTAPVLVAPIGGAYTASLNPDLIVGDALSPRGDTLTYDIEVYADVALTTYVSGVIKVADAAGDQVWQVDTDVALADNTAYYWRARASDSFVDGPWSALERFFVNAAEDAPSTPVLFQPIAGDVAPSLNPDLSWVLSIDPDGTAVSYDVQVWDESETTLITSATGVLDDTSDAYAVWTVDVSLQEDSVYAWTARAVDAAGSTSPWAAPELFQVVTKNAAPMDVVWVAPTEGAVLTEVSPVLQWSASTDPEGTAVSYRVEADVDSGFGAAQGEDVSVTSLDLAAAGLALVENSTVYLRVRAEDGGGVPSNWAVISVFVSGANDAPTAPTLLSPADGDETTDTTPTLSFAESTDLDNDPLTYEVVVSQHPDLSDAQSSGPVTVANGEGAWDVSEELAPGTWYWTASATDPRGGTASAATWSFSVAGGSTGDTGGESGDDCGCDGSAGGAVGLLGLVGFVLAGRRRAG